MVGRDFFPLRTPPKGPLPQLGISGMKSARIRNERQKKLHLVVPFFLPKVWGRNIFSFWTALVPPPKKIKGIRGIQVSCSMQEKRPCLKSSTQSPKKRCTNLLLMVSGF